MTPPTARESAGDQRGQPRPASLLPRSALLARRVAPSHDESPSVAMGSGSFQNRDMTRALSAPAALVTLVVIASVLGTSAPAASAQQTGRGARAPRDLQAELARIDLDRCFEDPAWGESTTRVSLVVHPDGVWALALDGAVTDASHASMAPALRTCLEDAIRSTWGELIVPAPRRDRVLVRTFDFRVHHEDPAVRLAELRARFDGARSDLARCVLDLAERRLVVEVRLGAEGRVEVVLPRPDVNRALCITNSLGVFMPGAVVAIRETIEARAAPQAVIAGERELCAWGGLGGPPPDDVVRTCAAGLRCCAAGGAAGSDSVCMRTSRCPALP